MNDIQNHLGIGNVFKLRSVIRQWIEDTGTDTFMSIVVEIDGVSNKQLSRILYYFLVNTNIPPITKEDERDVPFH